MGMLVLWPDAVDSVITRALSVLETYLTQLFARINASRRIFYVATPSLLRLGVTIAVCNKTSNETSQSVNEHVKHIPSLVIDYLCVTNEFT